MPNVVSHCRINVPLQIRIIGDPIAGLRVQMYYLAFFAAVAATLPREHGAPVTGCLGTGASVGQTAVAVHTKFTRQLGQQEMQERKNKKFIPENMAAIGFAVPAARRNSYIQLGGMQRNGLQQMKNMQPQNLLGPVVGGYYQVAALPELVPGKA